MAANEFAVRLRLDLTAASGELDAFIARATQGTQQIAAAGRSAVGSITAPEIRAAATQIGGLRTQVSAGVATGSITGAEAVVFREQLERASRIVREQATAMGIDLNEIRTLSNINQRERRRLINAIGVEADAHEVSARTAREAAELDARTSRRIARARVDALDADRARVAGNRARLGLGADDVAGLSGPQLLAENARLKQLIRDTQRQQRELAAAAARPVAAPTTTFQRLQSALRPGSGDPSSYQTFGQFAASRAITTASFAASGAAFYVLQSQVREMIREATALQTEFRIIEGVLESVGEAGGRSFETVREGILQVARDTAVAADEVARVQRSLAGIFADPETLQPDYGAAQIASESALRLQRVTALPTQEIADSVAAITLAYGGGAESVEAFGDVLVGLESQFGVTSSELVRFAAQIAGMGAELEIPQEQLLTIGAALLQVTESGSGAAEQLRRVIPGLQENASEVISIFSQLGADAADRLAASFGANDLSAVLNFMLENFRELSDGAQNELASLIGGTRQAGIVLSLFNRGPGVLNSLNQGADQFAGDLESRFSQVSQSVGFAFDQLERAIEEMGIALFEAGLSDALIAAADAGRVFAEVFGAILNLLGDMNDALGGLPAKFLALAVAVRGFQALNRVRQNAFGVGGVFGVDAIAAVPPVGGPIAGAIAPGPSSAITGAAATRARALGRARALATNRTLGGLSTLIVTEFLSGIADDQNFGGQSSNTDVGVSNALRGAGLGAAIGSFIPGIGTLAGAGVGGLLGGLTGVLPRQPDLEAYGAQRREFYEQVRETVEAYANQDAEAGRVLAAIANEGLNDENYRRLRAIVREGNLLEQVEEVESAQETIAEIESGAARRQLNFELAIDGFEAGITSQNEVIEAFNAEIRIQERLARAAEAAGEDSAEYDLAGHQARQQLNAFLAEQINARFDRAEQTIEAFGSPTGTNEQSLGVAQARLAALQAANASPEQLEAAAFDILAIQRRMLEDQIAAAEEIGEKIALAQQGIVADVNAAAVILEGQLQSLLDSGLSDALTRIAQASDNGIFGPGSGLTSALDRVGPQLGLTEFSGGLSDEEVDAIIQLIIETGEAETVAVRTILKNLDTRIQQIGRLMSAAGDKRLFPQILAATRQRDELLAIIEQLESAAAEQPENITSDARDLTRQAEDELEDQAEKDRQAFIDLQNARFDLLEAQVANDPVAVARIQQQRAQFAINTAQTEAERIRAEAERIRADRSLAEALADIVASQIDLAIAYADAAGDSVRSTQLQLQAAQQRLADLRNAGAGEAEINRAQAEIVSAQARVRDTQLSEQQELYQYLHDIGQITTQQLVGYLQGLLAFPELTEDARRDLTLQIKRLQDDLSTDFQYNLPSDLRLPTFYEARRLFQGGGNQAGLGSAGYNDNRQINVEVQVATNADPNQIAAAVANAIGNPYASGSAVHRY